MICKRSTLLGLIVLAACSSSTATPAALTQALPQRGSASGYISHVVVIIQENRSLENFFAGYPGANAPLSGCAIPEKGAPRRGSSSNCPPGDVSIALKPITFNSVDLGHDWQSSQVSWDKGKMDGFSKFCCIGGPYPAYSYVKQSLIQPYWDLAQQYVLADEMFPTEWGGSFTGHLTLVAGTDDINQTPSEAEIDTPANGNGCDSPLGTTSSYVTYRGKVKRDKGPFPCFTQWNSIAQVLDGAGVSWKYYANRKIDAGIWQPFEAMQYVRYGSDWKDDIIHPQTKILTDPGKGKLAAVSFVTPSTKDSDHPPLKPGRPNDGGPSWVASIVNAIGESSYWKSSAIIVVWDDWGGWYDNAKPPQLDYRGLGFRVPCLIISPYAKTGYVDNTQYEFASVLKFIEEVYGTGSIGPASEGYTDERATSIDNAFDFTQQPRRFTPIASKYSISRFLHEAPSNDPVDTQ
jgi:phospholipase C